MSEEARHIINANRAVSVMAGEAMGQLVGRVVSHLGMGHVSVLLDLNGRQTTVIARIPSLFHKKSTLTIYPDSFVSVYVGKDFDPEIDSLFKTHLEITCLFTFKKVQVLKNRGVIPLWMLSTEEEDSDAENPTFEFDDSVVAEDPVEE